MTPVGPRLPRFDQGFLALALISGFVFAAPQVIPVGTVLATVSAVTPTVSPIPWLVGRRSAAVPLKDAAPAGRANRAGYPPPWRFAALLSALLLAFGTLALAFGQRGIAWAFALPVAGLGALASVGGVCIGCQLYARLAR